MYYLKELDKTINEKNEKLLKDNEKLFHSYYTVKYNYDKESDTLLLSDINSIEVEDIDLDREQIKNIMSLPYNSNDINEVSNENIYYLSMSDFLKFTMENNISMAFPNSDKFLSFMGDKYLLDKYFEIKNHSSEGYILLRQSINKQYKVADQAVSSLNLISIFKKNNCEEATLLYDYLEDYLNKKDKEKIK